MVAHGRAQTSAQTAISAHGRAQISARASVDTHSWACTNAQTAVNAHGRAQASTQTAVDANSWAYTNAQAAVDAPTGPWRREHVSTGSRPRVSGKHNCFDNNFAMQHVRQSLHRHLDSEHVSRLHNDVMTDNSNTHNTQSRRDQ